MSVLKSKIIGLIMVVFAICFGFWYSLCVFINGSTESGLQFFRDDPFFGIPLLNEYWTIALPIYLLALLVLFLIGWLGIAAILTKEPQISEEEIRKVRELDKHYRSKKQEE